MNHYQAQASNLKAFKAFKYKLNDTDRHSVLGQVHHTLSLHYKYAPSEPTAKPYSTIITGSQAEEIIEKYNSGKYILKTIALSYGLTTPQVKTIINNYKRKQQTSISNN